MIVPGKSINNLRLRQPTSSLPARMGRPAKRTLTDSFREYWIYPEAGIDLMVSKRSKRVLSIFVHQPENSSTDSIDSLLNATEQEIRERFSSPSREGKPFSTQDKSFYSHWYSYDSGLGFHFNPEGRVETISIFAAKRKPTVARSAASHHHTLRKVAALRQS